MTSSGHDLLLLPLTLPLLLTTLPHVDFDSPRMMGSQAHPQAFHRLDQCLAHRRIGYVELNIEAIPLKTHSQLESTQFGGVKADMGLLEEALTAILAQVSYMLVKDGEGARKVIHVTVTGAANDADAELVARSVGHSQLVKTAIYGGDANWGRIVTAVGYSGAKFDPTKVSMKLCGIERFQKGCPVNDDQEDALAELLKGKDVQVDIELGNGNGSYSFKASDLGHEYVTLNSDYRS